MVKKVKQWGRQIGPFEFVFTEDDPSREMRKVKFYSRVGYEDAKKLAVKLTKLRWWEWWGFNYFKLKKDADG